MSIKALVVGGTGFLGYHICKQALKRKYIVHSLSLTKPKKKRKLKKVFYYKGDLKKIHTLKKINNSYDFVFNASGYGGISNKDNNKKIYNTHYFGLKNIIEKTKGPKLKKFIQFGSSNEYGNCNAPQKETMICKPKNSYGLAKYRCTKLLLNMYKKKKFPFVILRLFQVYGPYQNENRIIPYVIRKSKKNEEIIITKGEQNRDFCYIDDVIDAIFKCLNNKKANGEIINLGLGKSIKIKNVVMIIINKLRGGKPLFGKKKLKVKENSSLYPSIRKAKKILRWSPKTTFTQGLKKIIY